MTDRTVRVRLEAHVAAYRAAMGQAADSTRQWESQLLKSAHNNEQAFNTLGLAAVGVGAAVALGLGQAAFASRDFEKEMSGVASVANASADEMNRLSEAAIAAGASTELAGVTAMSAAQAEAELVKAGIDVADVLGGGLQGSLALATAGQVDMAEAASIAAAAMNTFNLAGEDVGHIADVLAGGANKSAADVGSLGMAMRQAGLVAGQTGVSLEETVGTLSAFADRGLQASDAGTSMRTMLLRLTPQSAEAAELFEQLGIKAFDAGGEFVGMAGLAGELQDALGGMSTEQRNAALNTLFGQDAIRGANVLLDLGAEGLRDYTQAVDDHGAAQRMAAIQTDNWAGDLEALGGAWESLMIDMGENAQGGLRGTTQELTDVVNGLAEMPEGAQTAALAVGGVTSAVSLAGGGFMLALPQIAKFKAALETAGPMAQLFGNGILRAGSALAGPWGIALGAAAGGLLYYLNQKGEAIARTNEFVATLDEETGALTRTSRAHVVSALAVDGAYAAAEKFGIANKDLTDAVMNGGPAWDALNARLTEGVQAGGAQRDAALSLQDAINGQRAAVEASAAVWQQRNEALGGSVPMSSAAAENHMRLKAAVEEGGAAAAYAAPQLDALGEAVAELTPLQEALNESLDGFVDPLRAYTDRLDVKETAEREAAEATAAATKDQEDSWEDYAKNVTVSLDDVMKELQKQVKAQESWHANMLILSTRVSEQTLEQLARMGPEGAPLVAELVDASAKELDRFEELAGQATGQGVNEMQLELINARPLLRKVARLAGEDTAEAFARKLAAGKTTVAEIAHEFGLTVKGEVETALGRLGRVKDMLVTIGQGTHIRLGNDQQYVPPDVPRGVERATGGDFGPGWLTVGERGPELMRVGQGGHVYNDALTRSMLASTPQATGAAQSIDYSRLGSEVAAAMATLPLGESNTFHVNGRHAVSDINVELRKRRLERGR